MSANDNAWRRPPGHPDNAAPSEPAAPPRAPAPPPATRPEDAVWYRPASGHGEAAARSPAAAPSANGTGPANPAVAEYSGPPPSNPPPAAWRPPIVAAPPPPGTLPEQDHDRIDVEERAARTLTTGIGLVAGAICLVLLLILCARAVFAP
jgi:hypothetical protein